MEKYQQMGDGPPECCGSVMSRQVTGAPMLKFRGRGGYPFRRKMIEDPYKREEGWKPL